MTSCIIYPQVFETDSPISHENTYNWIFTIKHNHGREIYLLLIYCFYFEVSICVFCQLTFFVCLFFSFRFVGEVLTILFLK